MKTLITPNNLKGGLQATDNGNPTLYSDQDLNKLIRGTIGAIRWSTFEIALNSLKSIHLKQLN